MATNEYDEMLSAEQPAAQGNEYSNLLAEDKVAQKASLQQSMFAASKAEPEQKAKALALSKQMNLPVDIVERNFDKLTKQAEVGQNDYDGIIEQTPMLAKWLEDPNNAALAKDDLPNLAGVEKSVKDYSTLSSMYGALNSGLSSLYANVARVPALVYDTAALPQNIAAKAFGRPDLQVQSPEWLRNNPVATFYDKQAEGFKVPEMEKSVTEEISKGNYAQAGKALAVQLVANLPQQAAIIAGTLTGYGIPATLGAGLTAASATNQRDKEAGVDPAAGTVNALAHGSIETLFERLGTFGVLKQWEGAIAKQYGKQVSKEVMKDLGKTLAYSMAAEGNEEALTSVAQDFSDYITGANPNALSGIAQRALDAGLIGAASGGAITSPSALGATIARKNQARAAQVAKDFYLSLGKSAEATKLRQRMPEAKRALVEQLTQGSPVENIYIPLEAVEGYFQSAKINTVKAMQDMGVLEAYNDAKEAGTDVQVPLSTWVEKVVGTEHFNGLANDVKFSPTELTVNEASQARTEVQSELEAQAGQVEAAQTEGKEDPSVVAELQAESIKSNVVEQLQAAGYDSKTAGAYAQVYQAAFKTMGERAGVNPLDLFSRYGLQIRKEGQVLPEDSGQPSVAESVASMQTMSQDEVTRPIETQVLEQSSIRKQRAESMGFDTSKVWYHGTNRNIEEFEGHRAGRSGRKHGEVFWFTTNPEIASDFSEHAAETDYYRGAQKIDIKADEKAAKKVRELHNKWQLATEKATRLELEAQIDEIESERLAQRYRGQNIVPTFLKGENPLVHDAGGKFLKEADINKVLEQAKAGGHDSVLFQNMIDSPRGGTETPSEVMAVFSPKQIRSVNAEFDTDKADSANILHQSGTGDARGRISFGANRQFKIELLKKADLSTFLHETGHFYLEVLGDLASGTDANPAIKEDLQTILDWMGVSSRAEIKTEHHEKFARGFEAYLMEGNAPSSALRAAFTRFKLWLTTVYQRMRGLDVELTPEVRSVMDRMLATDDQIEMAFAELNVKPLFADPKQAGMSEKQAAKYSEAMAEAREAARETVNAKLMADYRKTQTTIYKEEREVLRAEIEKEVSARPVYVAIEKIRGNEEIRLSRESVKEFGADVAKQLPKGVIATKSKGGGLNVDMAADLLGYASGQELITDMVKAPKMKYLVDQMTDAQMAERFPDLLTDGQLPEEALRAAHNQKRSQLLRMELEHLASNNMPLLKDAIRRVARRMPSEKEVRELATRTIGKRQVKDLKPHLYQRAEIKAAKEAGQALAKGDLEKAFEAKRRELLNHELYRATVEAQETHEDALEKFKKISKADDKIAKSRDMDLVNTARAILASVGIGKSEKPAAAYIEQIRKYDADTFATVQALIESVSEIDRHHSQLTFDKFVNLTDTVVGLWDLARTNKQIEIDGKIMDRDQVKGELQARLAELSDGTQRAGYDRAATTWDKVKMGLLGVKAALRRVESWIDTVDGGNPDGVFRRYILNPVLEATTQYRLAKNEKITKYLEIVKGVEKSLTFQPIAAPELGYTFRDKAELLGAILHSGNESNLSKLLRGRGWGSEGQNGELDLSRWNAFLTRMYQEGVLGKTEYDFAQAVWDLLEEIKTPAQQAHKKMYGHYFGEISANEIQTPFGTFRGGYVPAVADPFLSEDAAIRGEKEALEKNNNSFMFPTAGRGFSKSRVEQYSAPLSLDLKLVPMHIDKVLRFTHIEPAVKSVGRIVMDKGFRKSLEALDPTVGGDMLMPWLQRAAQQRAATQSQGWGGKAADKFFSAMRRRTGLQVMAVNVVNALQNVGGISMAAVKVRPSHLRDALWAYVKAPSKTAEAVIEKSDFMKTRMSSQTLQIQQQIDDMLLNPSKYDEFKRFAEGHGYFLSSAFQNVIDVVAWNGAYDEAITDGMTEKDAVRHADSVVRATQGSFNIEDGSRFEAGSPLVRVLSMFYSYFNMQANLLGTEFTKTIRDLGLKKGAGRLVYVYTMGFMVPAVLAELMVQSMSGKDMDGDDDEQYLDDLMRAFFGSQFRTATAMFPIVGPSVQAGVNAFNDKWYDDRISTSPAVAMIESAVNAPNSVYKAITDDGSKKRAVRDSLSALGLLTGLPLVPISRPVGYLLDVAEGKGSDKGPLDAVRGLATGKVGE